MKSKARTPAESAAVKAARDAIPELEGYISLPRAGKKLKVSRQRLFQMVDEGVLTSIRRISGAGSRPAAYVVKTVEVEKLLQAQREADEPEAQPALAVTG
jgi:hypothetical protein